MLKASLSPHIRLQPIISLRSSYNPSFYLFFKILPNCNVHGICAIDTNDTFRADGTFLHVHQVQRPWPKGRYFLCPHGPPSPRKKFLLCRDALWIGYGHRRDPIYFTSGFGPSLVLRFKRRNKNNLIHPFNHLYLIDKSSSNLFPRRS